MKKFFVTVRPDEITSEWTVGVIASIGLIPADQDDDLTDRVDIWTQDESNTHSVSNTYRGQFQVTEHETILFPAEDGGLCCLIDDKAWVLPPFLVTPISDDPQQLTFADVRDAIIQRNSLAATPLPSSLTGIAAINVSLADPSPRHAISRAEEFPFHTSQEMDALYRAQSDGKTFSGFLRNDQAGAIVHQRNGSSHSIRMQLTEAERAAGIALTYLEDIARSQDADAIMATSYILGVLAPAPHLPARPYAGGWIDFDDVIKKIGWYPQTTKDRRDMHAKIWEFVKFAERAHIVGKRTGAKYIDAEGNAIETTIHGAAWRVMKTETPDQSGLFETTGAPVRAEIVVSKELTALISNPKAAQYFQCGEILGAIPNGKPAGAWARVLGLALLSFWRRKPREHSAGVLKPTRRELLDHYVAKISPYEEILDSPNPTRAIDYWCSALQILADDGFIERTGEAAITAKEMRASLPRKGWKDIWLDQSVTIEVGTKTKPAFEKIINSLHQFRPRDLKRKPRAMKSAKSG